MASAFERVGVAVGTPKMLRLEINDPDRVFEDRYYMWKSDVDAYLKGERKNVPIFKMSWNKHE